jgi:hypothetical protein
MFVQENIFLPTSRARYLFVHAKIFLSIFYNSEALELLVILKKPTGKYGMKCVFFRRIFLFLFIHSETRAKQVEKRFFYFDDFLIYYSLTSI